MRKLISLAIFAAVMIAAWYAWQWYQEKKAFTFTSSSGLSLEIGEPTIVSTT